MLTNNLFQNIPDFRNLLLNKLLCCLDGGRHTPQLELIEDERLKQFKGHQLGKTTLMQLERWSNHDDGTPRIVHTLTQKVLTETPALTFNHVCKRLEWSLVRACHRLATTAVIQQGIHCLLEHPFFIAHNNVRRL